MIRPRHIVGLVQPWIDYADELESMCDKADEIMGRMVTEADELEAENKALREEIEGLYEDMAGADI